MKKVKKLLEHPIERPVIWKDIPGYEGLYQINNNGEVKSLERVMRMKNGRIKRIKGGLRVTFKHEEGYDLVVLHNQVKRKIHRIHRLVAQSFIPNPNNYPEVNHKNALRDDNRLENLEWCTGIENKNYSFNVMGNFGKHTNKLRGVEFNRKSNKWKTTICFMGKRQHLGYFENKQEAYEAYYQRFIQLRGFEPWDKELLSC